ncbi:hypothetical protein M885DRAFT_520148 [Pelagophyceae sp. CCMP2097]|nr:hypothetical protein M885DRAFT_520148 [Pelagophyceae sp. CCMP2097]
MRRGNEARGLPPLATRELNTSNRAAASCADLVGGGRRVVATGVVLPAGMRLRHPALMHPATFQRDLKEFLILWDGADGVVRAALGAKIERLWLAFTFFRRLAKHAYRRGRRRANAQEKAIMRIVVFCPSGAAVDVKTNALSTALDVKAQLARLRVARCPDAGKRPKRYVLYFDGHAVPDAMSLYDAGVRPRSTLSLSTAQLPEDEPAKRPSLAAYLDVVAPLELQSELR